MADTDELARDGWREYFDNLSRALTTTQATVEIEAPELGSQIQAANLVLVGMSYDDRDDVLVVGLSPGGGAPESLEHLISSPRRIWAESSDLLPSTIEIEDSEGQRTIVRLQAAPTLTAE